MWKNAINNDTLLGRLVGRRAIKSPQRHSWQQDPSMVQPTVSLTFRLWTLRTRISTTQKPRKLARWTDTLCGFRPIESLKIDHPAVKPPPQSNSTSAAFHSSVTLQFLTEPRPCKDDLALLNSDLKPSF